MKIYIYGTNLLRVENTGLYLSLLPKWRIRMAENLSREDDRRRCLSAGLALREALLREGVDILTAEFYRDSHGKPCLKQSGRQLYFNLSHAGGLAVCAVDYSELGIDIVKTGSVRENVLKSCLSAAERELVRQCAGSPCLYKERSAVLWAVKESYLKATGEGIRRRMDTFEIEYDDKNKCARLIKGGRAYFRVNTALRGYVFAVCSFEKLPVLEIYSADTDGWHSKGV